MANATPKETEQAIRDRLAIDIADALDARKLVGQPVTPELINEAFRAIDDILRELDLKTASAEDLNELFHYARNPDAGKPPAPKVRDFRGQSRD